MELVWENEDWWLAHLTDRRIDNPWWNVQRATDKTLIAYYRNAENAERDRWTPIKPVRYLATFTALPAAEVKYWATYQSSGKVPEAGDPSLAQFATTPDDIEAVYLNGPSSCMSHEAICYESSEHPVRVYGAGDLAIAYLGGIDPGQEVTARALCWPERKVFGRRYGDDDEVLACALLAMGYRDVYGQGARSAFNGARLLRIEDDDSLIVPYLDQPCQNFNDDGEYLTMHNQGEHCGQETSGLVSMEPRYEYHCECCDEGFNDGGTTVYTLCGQNGGHRERHWCECCAENTFYCQGFNETFSGVVASDDWGGETYTQAWLDDNTFISDYSGERFSTDDLVTMHNGDIWSEDEFDRYGQEIDGKRYAKEDAIAEIERRAASEDDAQLTMEV